MEDQFAVGCALKLESSRSTCLVSCSERAITDCSDVVGIVIACRFVRWLYRVSNTKRLDLSGLLLTHTSTALPCHKGFWIYWRVLQVHFVALCPSLNLGFVDDGFRAALLLVL
jgi:hypothetical protein